jgi:hypothetical protein
MKLIRYILVTRSRLIELYSTGFRNNIKNNFSFPTDKDEDEDKEDEDDDIYYRNLYRR